MIRISFRQSMLAGFLLIALLLGWAAVQSWLVLEQFVAQSHRGNAQALELRASIQELAERTVDLERSTRQYLVLNDSVLLDRFDQNAQRALTAVARLEALPTDAFGKHPDAWRENLLQLSQGLHNAKPQDQLLPLFARLTEINVTLDRQGRQWIDAQHARMTTTLEERRLRLASLVATAVAGSGDELVAFAANRHD